MTVCCNKYEHVCIDQEIIKQRSYIVSVPCGPPLPGRVYFFESKLIGLFSLYFSLVVSERFVGVLNYKQNWRSPKVKVLLFGWENNLYNWTIVAHLFSSKFHLTISLMNQAVSIQAKVQLYLCCKFRNVCVCKYIK